MNIDFEKNKGLVPAIIQDNTTGKVLMLGYMNRESYEKTTESGKVTFYSRSRQKLWTKGEESGNSLNLVSVTSDCDNDTLLVKVHPEGPVCHTGSDTCWNEKNSASPLAFLEKLEAVISSRRGAPVESSYTARLFDKGVKKIAQKVGEEATELVLEAMDNDPDLFLGEAADLVYHLLVLLNAKGFSLGDVTSLLETRS